MSFVSIKSQISNQRRKTRDKQDTTRQARYKRDRKRTKDKTQHPIIKVKICYSVLALDKTKKYRQRQGGGDTETRVGKDSSTYPRARAREIERHQNKKTRPDKHKVETIDFEGSDSPANNQQVHARLPRCFNRDRVRDRVKDRAPGIGLGLGLGLGLALGFKLGFGLRLKTRQDKTRQ